MAMQKVNWNSVDWTKRDIDIAETNGVSRERVRQVRKANGIARARHEHQSRRSIPLIRWLEENRERAGNLTYRQIAKASNAKIGLVAIRKQCLKLGIARPLAWWHDATINDVRERATINENGCWIFNTAKNAYARIGTQYGHHFVFKLVHGSIPKGLWVLHTCDVSSCVNPSHLYAGTPKQNTWDAIKRKHRRAVVSEADRERIREMRRNGASIRELAVKFGIKDYTARQIVADVQWKLPEEKICGAA